MISWRDTMRNCSHSSREGSSTIIAWKNRSYTARDCTSAWLSSASSNPNRDSSNNASKPAKFVCRRCPNKDRPWQMRSRRSSARNRPSMLRWTQRNLVISSPRSRLSRRVSSRSILPTSRSAERCRKNCYKLSLHTATSSSLSIP